MKYRFLFLIGMIIVISLGLSFTISQVQKSSGSNMVLPASLDNLFPPKAEQPVYLYKMIELAAPLSGIVVDLMERDLENSLANFEKFKVQYRENSKLVPEWESFYPIGPITELEIALKTGDPAKVMPAMEAMGQVCSNCHVQYMPLVQHKYHWGDFNGITLEDPLTQQEVSFRQFMLFLDASLTGISLDIQQGQTENARKQLQGFSARFEAMKESCMNCHDTERLYYVDEKVKTMIDKMDEVLNTSPVDPKKVDQISGGIGMESCFKCHLVHVPAAVTQLSFIK